MTFVTGKHLDRRTVLRGLGGAIALPLLDAMLPAFADSKGVTQARRLAIVYVPNGIHDLAIMNGADMFAYFSGSVPDGLVWASPGGTPHPPP